MARRKARACPEGPLWTRAKETVPWSLAVAEAIVARVAAGEVLYAVLREEGMPTPQSVGKWAKANAEFFPIPIRQDDLADHFADAIAEYRHALQLNQDYAEAHNNLGNALWDKGQLDAAHGGGLQRG